MWPEKDIRIEADLAALSRVFRSPTRFRRLCLLDFMGLKESMFLSSILSSGCFEITSCEPPTVIIKTHITNICNCVLNLLLLHGTFIFPLWLLMKLLFRNMASYETHVFFHYRIKLNFTLNVTLYFEATCFFKAQDIPYIQTSSIQSGLSISSVADIQTFFSYLCFFLLDMLRISLRALFSNSFVNCL